MEHLVQAGLLPSEIGADDAAGIALALRERAPMDIRFKLTEAGVDSSDITQFLRILSGRPADIQSGLARLFGANPRELLPPALRAAAAIPPDLRAFPADHPLRQIAQIQGVGIVIKKEPLGDRGQQFYEVSIALLRKLDDADFKTFQSLVLALDEGERMALLFQKKPFSLLIKNEPGYVTVSFHHRGPRSNPTFKVLSFHEGDLSVDINREEEKFRVTNRTIPGQPIPRLYVREKEGYVPEPDKKGDVFAEITQQVYRRIWKIPDAEIDKRDYRQDFFVTHDPLGRKRMARLAQAVQSENDSYLRGEVMHPHLVVDLMWQAMLTPTFAKGVGLDWTKVTDEGKTIEWGEPVSPGAEIEVIARIAFIEDFNIANRVFGRRVAVSAEAYTLNDGKINDDDEKHFIAKVFSTFVCWVPNDVKLVPKQTKATKRIYENLTWAGQGDLLNRFPLDKLIPTEEVSGGNIVIPWDLADTYGDIDANAIHLSDLAAAMAGLPDGRIMQGLGTLAYVNERILASLPEGLILHRLMSLKFERMVKPGDSLNYEVTHLGHVDLDEEKNHLFHVKVKRDSKSVLSYQLSLQETEKTTRKPKPASSRQGPAGPAINGPGALASGLLAGGATLASPEMLDEETGAPFPLVAKPKRPLKTPMGLALHGLAPMGTRGARPLMTRGVL